MHKQEVIRMVIHSTTWYIDTSQTAWCTLNLRSLVCLFKLDQTDEIGLIQSTQIKQLG